jgi:hypothetical protein
VVDAPAAKPKPVILDRTVRMGDLLTSCSVLISAIGLIVTWTNETHSHRRQQADQIRNAAAVVLAKMDRWEEISFRAFSDLEPVSVEISRRFQNTSSPESVRDYAWTRIDAVAADTRSRQFEEQIEGAYVSLYGYDPKVRSQVRTTVQALDARQETMFADLEASSQRVILGADSRLAKAHPAILGDDLRRSMAAVRDRYRPEIEDGLATIRTSLERVATSTDDQLLAHP